ncbi:MAG: LPS assembly lipoprotein LptE [Flavobacteriales bacterium]|nr:LPS assembly lipoprotein LptE [Flavobacteriales bacterium]
MNLRLRIAIILAITSSFIFLESCKIKYSFTGASICPEATTISIQYFENYAPLAPPTIGQDFTEKLRDAFISQTNLNLIDNGGDLKLEGKITFYRADPIAVQSSEVAAQNRLTIKVDATYETICDPKQNFQRTFTRFADFDASTSLSSVESTLIEEINDQLVQDIFNQSVSNW